MFDKHFIGQNAAGITAAPQFAPISKVVLLVDDERSFVAGDDTGREMELTCPYGSQAMANDLLTRLQGYAYRPMTAQDALLDPAAELGDGVTVGGVYTILAEMDTLFDMHCAADIAAPGEDEVNSEYKYQTPEKRLERQLAQTRSLISKTAEQIRLEIQGVDGRLTSLSTSISGIEGRVEGVEGEFASFLLDTDGFFVFDENGNRSAVRGSSIDTTTLNVQNINFTGVIQYDDFDEDTQIYFDEIYDLAAEAYDLADSVQLPDYIQDTYIDRVLIKSPTIEANDIGLYGGYFVVKNSAGTESYGSFGYGSGLDSDGTVTTGVVMSAGGNTGLGSGNYYLIVTNAGVRMQAGDHSIYVTENGCYTSDGTTATRIGTGTCVFG